MTLFHSPSVQSPAGYSAQNLSGAQLAVRMAGTASAAQRLNLRTALQDSGFRYKIHPNETAAGLVEANLIFGYDPGQVERYGAAADGVTDDTLAIQRAINVAGVVGGWVTFAAATYKFTQLLMKAKVQLVGQSMYSTVLTTATAGNGITMASPINTSTGVGTHVRDLTLTCTNGANIGAGYVDVCGTLASVTRCAIRGFQDQIIFDQTELGTIEHCDLELATDSAIWLVNGSDHTPGVTFTAGLAAGAVAGPLTGNWTGATGHYNLNFIETVGGASEPREVLLTNGSNAVTWSQALTNACNAVTTAANQGFTNRINILRNQLNNVAGTGTAVIDDGGTCHTFKDNNFNGWQSHIYIAACTNLKIDECEFEGSTSFNFTFQKVSKKNGIATGVSTIVAIEDCFISPPANQIANIVAAGNVASFNFNRNRTITSAAAIINTVNIGSVFAYGNMDSNAGTLFDGLAGTSHFEMAVANTSIKVKGDFLSQSRVMMSGAALAAQQTGFGTPTGAALTANFPGATATLAQTSGQLAELLVLLKALGVIGN
jgi:hypothetical protein